MNIAISAFVGVLVAMAAVVGGVHAAQGDQTPVKADRLYQYSTR